MMEVAARLENKHRSKMAHTCRSECIGLCHMRDVIKKVPDKLPANDHQKLLSELLDISAGDVHTYMQLNIEEEELKISGLGVFGPPVSKCVTCLTTLLRRTSCDVTVVDIDGITMGRKVNLRCFKCLVTYQYSRFGNSEAGFHFYEDGRDFVEVSDVILASKAFCEIQCSLSYFIV